MESVNSLESATDLVRAHAVSEIIVAKRHIS